MKTNLYFLSKVPDFKTFSSLLSSEWNGYFVRIPRYALRISEAVNGKSQSLYELIQTHKAWNRSETKLLVYPPASHSPRTLAHLNSGHVRRVRRSCGCCREMLSSHTKMATIYVAQWQAQKAMLHNVWAVTCVCAHNPIYAITPSLSIYN